MNERDQAIVAKAAAGAKPSALAKEYGLSTTRIGRIIKAAAQEGKPASKVPEGAYLAMICHYEAIARFRKRNPHRKDLPEHLDEADDEIRAICAKRGWEYPGIADGYK